MKRTLNKKITIFQQRHAVRKLVETVYEAIAFVFDRNFYPLIWFTITTRNITITILVS